MAQSGHKGDLYAWPAEQAARPRSGSGRSVIRPEIICRLSAQASLDDFP
jgi:hypothetical protein